MARQAERGLLGVLLCALAWAPLPLAGNRPWALVWLAALMCSLLAAAMWLQAWPRRREAGGRSRAGAWVLPPWPEALRRARWPLGLLGAFAAWVGVQGWVLPGGSADPHESRLYLLRALACLSAFGTVLLLVTSDRRRLALFYGLLGAGLLQALIAIALFANGGHYDLAGTPVHHAGRALGTFANADHLAHYMALTLSAGVGLMLAGMGGKNTQPRPAGWRGQLLGFLEFMMSVKMLVRLMLVVLVIVLVLTRSRMGNGSFFLSLFVLGGWVMVSSAKLRRPAAILVTSLLIVDLIVIGQWVGLEKVVKRLEATEISVAEAEAASAAAAAGASVAAAAARAPATPRPFREETLEERLRAAADTLEAVRARPWTGWGAGTFYVVFPQFKRPELGVRFDHAHNDYTEIAADVGLPALALLCGVFALTLARVVRLVRDDQPSERRGLAVGIAMAMLCALLHAFVDFNLQIPANALTLTVLLAAAWSMPLYAGARAAAGARSESPKG